MNKATNKIINYQFWEEKPTLADIKKCIQEGADLTQLVHTEYGYTYPLAFYAAEYLPDAIPLMVKAGMDVNQPSPEGTAVQLASYSSKVSPLGMQRLLENGADIKVKTVNAGLGSPDPERQEILNEFSQGTGFFLPSYTGISCVGWALTEGVNMCDNPDYKDAEEQRQKVEMLFKAGIHPDAPAYNGEPPIFHTTCCGYEKATQMILNCGGNINVRSISGDTVLTKMGKRIAKEYSYEWYNDYGLMDNDQINCAQARQYMGMLHLLISKGASLNLPDGEGLSFEDGPASQIPFVDEIIRTYHKNGIEGVDELAKSYYKKWEKEDYECWFKAYQCWFKAYQSRKLKDASLRKETAKGLRAALSEKTDEGRKKAMKIAQKFHKPDCCSNGKFNHEIYDIVKEKLRPTALKFKKER